MTGEWKKFEVTLTAKGSDPKARFALHLPSTGTLGIDFVSLFPAKTWRDRPNGLRPDLAQIVADLKPGFVRWPGGCFAEGINVESRPQWKRSIGRLEDRTGTYSPWGYWSSDGFGYYEFLQFSEDVGADALFVVNVGVSCSMRSGTYLEDSELPGLIEDALDAIEYAIGPVSSEWGALRAKHGHPAPFPLKYIEIGNEQRGERYGQRVAMFYKAIKAKYPQLKIALSSWIAGVDQRIIDAAGKIDIVDEHAYKALHWGIENFDSFASYKRQGWDLYIGEFATNAGVGRGNVLAMLNDAAYMMSMEKNTDLVKMGSYAPLLENVNDRDWPVNMIHFDSSRAYARATYYANKLFAENLPTVNLTTAVDYRPAGSKPITARVGVATHDTAAEFKDVVVERGGKTLFQSDFTSASGWTPEGTTRALVSRRRGLSAGRSRGRLVLHPRNRRRRLHRLAEGAEDLRPRGLHHPHRCRGWPARAVEHRRLGQHAPRRPGGGRRRRRAGARHDRDRPLVRHQDRSPRPHRARIPRRAAGAGADAAAHRQGPRDQRTRRQDRRHHRQGRQQRAGGGGNDDRHQGRASAALRRASTVLRSDDPLDENTFEAADQDRPE